MYAWLRALISSPRSWGTKMPPHGRGEMGYHLGTPGEDHPQCGSTLTRATILVPHVPYIGGHLDYPCLTITEILAGCPHTLAERANWPRRGSYADHARQFPECCLPAPSYAD